MCFASQNLVHRASPFARSLQFLLPSLALLQKTLQICELPHIGAAKKYASPLSASSMRHRGDANARMDWNRRRVAIGPIWTVAAMSNLVPVDGSEMSLASISRPAE
jgi:hypothetical protein